MDISNASTYCYLYYDTDLVSGIYNSKSGEYDAHPYTQSATY